MKRVLHVTEELSKKNYSIASLIFFLCNYIENKILVEHVILATYIQKEIFKQSKNVKIINLPLLSNFFSINDIISEIIKDKDVVHVHGLWRWINFVTIFHCIVNNKTFYIHPHGMLLDAALKNKGYLSFVIKRFFIYCYKIVIDNKVRFVSITGKETKSIKKYFSNSILYFIPNPIPLIDKSNKFIKKNKTFVFFGRIHPIKNLELMIEAFKVSNLGNEWKLHIYGIEDEHQYLLLLKDLIKNNKNIEIKDPVFFNEKQKILKTSWSNILLSKSEVLSLSVLESASMELPSIVSEDIKIDQFSMNEGVSVKPNIIDISKKIIEVSKWSLQDRIKKGKKLKGFIEKNFSINTVGKKYLEIYKPVQKKIVLREFNFLYYTSNYIKKYSILNISLAFILNLMIPTFLMITLVLSGNSIIAAEIALVNSLWLTMTQIFSNNIRTQAIAKNDSTFLTNSILFRFILVFIFIVIAFAADIVNNLTNSYDSNYILQIISSIILMQWMLELVLTSYEINKKTLKIFFVNIFNSISILIFIFVIFFLNLNYLKIALMIYLFILITIFYIENKTILWKFHKKNIYKIILANIRSVAFFSSFSIIFSSFVWRYLIFSFYSKEIAAIIFACFSVGSFPATIFNSSIGPTFVKLKTKLNKNLKIVISVLFFLTLCNTILSFTNLSLNKPLFLPRDSFVLHTLSFSILGSFLMTYAMYLRQISIQNNFLSRDKTFWLDTVYGSSITVLLPVLYLFNSIYYVSLTFFFASIISLIIYGIFLKFKSNVTFIKR